MTSETSDSQHHEDQLEAIDSITDVAIGRLDIDAFLRAMLLRLTSVLNVDTAAVLLLDRQGRYLIARAALGIEEEVRQGVQIRVGTGFAGRIAADRTPIAIDRVDASTVQNPILWERGIRAMLGVPLESGSLLLGVLHVGTLTDRRFNEADKDLLQMASSRIAAALQARQLENEMAAAGVLQRSLLPTALPECAGVEFASRYVPAEAPGVGGDWYDAFCFPSGDLWIIAGDIAGHGLHAAVVMGRLRSAIRAYALEGYEPGDLLARADKKLQFFEPGQMATAFCALLREPYDSIQIASAGHLPPVLAVPGQRPELIRHPISPPLGSVDNLAPDAIEIEFPLGSVLVGYTDGLIERRKESIEVGLSRLLDATGTDHPEIVCRHLMASLVGQSVPQDDIAIIAARRIAA